MGETKKIRLCRMLPARRGAARCIGVSCSYYYERDGANHCLLEPHPKDRWTGSAWVIEATESDIQTGRIHGVDFTEDSNEANIAGFQRKERKPDLSGASINQIQSFLEKN